VEKLKLVAGNRQTVATTLAAAAKYILTITGLHSFAESVCLETVAVVRLIGAFHSA
jgi:hypothetical protein